MIKKVVSMIEEIYLFFLYLTLSLLQVDKLHVNVKFHISVDIQLYSK